MRPWGEGLLLVQTGHHMQEGHPNDTLWDGADLGANFPFQDASPGPDPCTRLSHLLLYHAQDDLAGFSLSLPPSCTPFGRDAIRVLEKVARASSASPRPAT